MMAVNRRRKMTPGFVKKDEFDKENLKTCGLRLICHVTEEFKKEQNIQRTHINEILHSIFFLGFIHKYSLTPEDILSANVVEAVRQEFPQPFEQYNSHLPKQTPFSILLEIMQLKYGTKDKVLPELCSLMEELKFPFPLDRPANINQRFYTLESTVICVCSNSQRTSDEYFGASLGCRTENAKSIMIYSSCINTWHEYVSYVVMSFKHKERDSCLQFPESLQCQAYFRDWKDNTYKEKPPCMNCKKLFLSNRHTSGTEDEPYPYGNCAETECLSKLLINDPFMRENIEIRNYTPDKMNKLKECTRKRLRNKLASIPSRMNNGDLLFFEADS